MIVNGGIGMEIKQLKYFLEVAKREHLSDAALELDIAQSAISRQIQQLEDELQVKLFKRQGRNIRLTTAGKDFVIHATKLLNQVDETLTLFRQQESNNLYSINLGYEQGYVTERILPLIQTFERQYDSKIIPQQVSQDSTKQILVDALDVAITELTPTLQQNNDLNVTLLYEETYHLYLPKEEPLALAMNPNLAQFEGATIFTLTPLSTTMIALIEQLTKATLHVVTHPALAQYLLAQHRGFILAPDYQRLTVSSLDYKDISLNHTPLKRSICIVVRKENNKPDVQQLTSLIQTLFNRVSTYH